MKFIIFLVVFIRISGARPIERIEEILKSRVAQLTGFNEDTKVIVKNFNITISNDIIQLNKKILEINEERRIQGNRLNHGIEFKNDVNASVAKNNSEKLVENIRKNIDSIPAQLYLINGFSVKAMSNFISKMENDVVLLDHQIQESAQNRFSGENFLSHDIESMVISIIAQKQRFVDGLKRKIQGQVNHCFEQASRYIEYIRRKMNYYIVKIQAAVKILDTEIQNAKVRSRYEWENSKQHIEKDIEDAVNELNKNIQEYIKELTGEIRDTGNNLVKEGNCFNEGIYAEVNDLQENIEDNVGKLLEKMKTAVIDPINGEIARQLFGISEETRKPPVNSGMNVISIDGGKKTFICNGGFSINDKEVKCGDRPSYFREVEDKEVDGILYHSEKYFKPITNTMEGFKYSLDMNDPNSKMEVQEINNTLDKNEMLFEASSARSSNIRSILVYFIVLTIIFYM